MKTKLFILVFAIMSISFAGIQNVNAQTPVDYSFWAEWVDENCDGGEILEKELYFEIIYISTGLSVDWGYSDVTSTSNPYEVLDNGPIFIDCEDCYKVSVKVRYRDSEGWFCSGEDYVICDGEELINGDEVYVTVTMN
jgi:hypothetical protein